MGCWTLEGDGAGGRLGPQGTPCGITFSQLAGAGGLCTQLSLSVFWVRNRANWMDMWQKPWTWL